jgi:hypothetical protein
MKFLLIVSLSLSGLFANAVEYKDVEITTKIKVAVLEVEAACVEFVNSEGESDGGPDLYYTYNSFTQVSNLAAQGLASTVLQNGEICRSKDNGGTMTYVTAASFSDAKAIHALVRKNGGDKKVKVAFYNYATVLENFNGSIVDALESVK